MRPSLHVVVLSFYAVLLSFDKKAGKRCERKQRSSLSLFVTSLSVIPVTRTRNNHIYQRQYRHRRRTSIVVDDDETLHYCPSSTSLHSSWYNTNQPQQQDDEYEEDSPTYLLNLQLRNLVYQSSNGDSNAAIESEDLLRRMEDGSEGEGAYPDTVSYNQVINAYAKSSLEDSAIRAENVLSRMERVYEDQLELNRLWYTNHQKDRMSDTDEVGEGEEQYPPPITVRPNVRSYSTVIDAWSRSPDTTAPHRAEAVLSRLTSLYDRTKEYDLRPNSYVYNAIINAWAKGNAGELGARKAEEYLYKMEEENLVDVISYNAAMHAWARSGVEGAGYHAEALLRRMQHRASEEESGGCTHKVVRPNARSYGTAIHAWGRCTSDNDAANRAHALLEEMEEEYNRTGDIRVQPNFVAYSAVMDAYARSKEREKGTVALKLLRKMSKLYDSGENRYAKPSVVTYNTVLNAFATSCARVTVDRKDSALDEKKEQPIENSPREYGEEEEEEKELMQQRQLSAMNSVRELYNELITGTNNAFHLQPDHFTYGTVLKACGNLMDPSDDDKARTNFIREVFTRCCTEGMVSFGVLFQLKQAAPLELYRELIPREALDLETDYFRIKDVPSEWKRNVRESGPRGGRGVKRFR